MRPFSTVMGTGELSGHPLVDLTHTVYAQWEGKHRQENRTEFVVGYVVDLDAYRMTFFLSQLWMPR